MTHKVALRRRCSDQGAWVFRYLGKVKIELRHMGRYALAAGELLRMALAERLCGVHAVYSSTRGGKLE